MSNIVIIGQSMAAISAIESIRQHDTASTITLIAPEMLLPYDRTLLPALVAKDIKESQLGVPTAFFKQHQVNVVLDETITRISTKRNQVTTESKKQFPFDRLLITDMPHVRLPSIKGTNKKGVFDVYRHSSVKELIKYLPYADHVIVTVNSFAGFDMACALSRQGKEVTVLTPPQGLLGSIFDDDTTALLKQIVEGNRMRVLLEGLEEVLGDAEVKAVRLLSGKVMAAEMVVVDNITPDLRLLADTGLADEGVINVGEFFNSAVEGVFACDGALGAFDLLTGEARAQGACAGANMLSLGGTTYQPPTGLRSFGPKVCDGFCGGHVRLPEGGREHMVFDGPSNVFKKIFVLNDVLIGAVWLNCLDDRARVEQALLQKMSLAGAEEQFLQSAHV